MTQLKKTGTIDNPKGKNDLSKIRNLQWPSIYNKMLTRNRGKNLRVFFRIVLW